MRKTLLIFLAGLGLTLLESCKDDGFPVPPASVVPNFEFSVSNGGFAPATATFADLSVIPDRAGNVSYAWDFGDGGTSSEVNPVHDYTDPGEYTVTLTITSFTLSEATESSQSVIINDADASGTNFFFWAGALRKTLINESTPIVSTIVTSATAPFGIAVDTVNDKLYIGDNETEKIYVSGLSGNDFHEFRTGTGSVNGLVIDYQTSKIYWGTDEGNIHRADLSNATLTQIETVVSGQINAPTGLAIHPGTRRLFWNNYDGGLWSKNIDVAGGESLFLANPDGGGSVTIVGDRVLYDEWNTGNNIKIKSVNLAGGDEKLIADQISRLIFSAIMYNPRDGKVYWSDRTAGKIRRADLDGGNREDYYSIASPGDDNYPRAFALGKYKE